MWTARERGQQDLHLLKCYLHTIDLPLSVISDVQKNQNHEFKSDVLSIASAENKCLFACERSQSRDNKICSFWNVINSIDVQILLPRSVILDVQKNKNHEFKRSQNCG